MLVTAQEELLLAQRLVGDVAGGAGRTTGAADLVASARRRLSLIGTSRPTRSPLSNEVAGCNAPLTLRSSATGVVVEKRHDGAPSWPARRSSASRT
ncbi:MAG: hypothetical protein IPN47_23110 [Gemmatimonadetes bacterium]|nr:hypothetical protein [Gemmatimonadota bacterium]